MALRIREINGEKWVKAPGQDWRPASAIERVGMDTGPLEAFGLGVASYPSNLYESLRGLAAGSNPVSMQEHPDYVPSGAQQAAENVGQFHPTAVAAGQMAPDLATLPLGGTSLARGAAAAGRSLTGIPERVAAGIRQAGQRAVGRRAAGAIPESMPPGTSLDAYGLPQSTAGAQQVNAPRTLLERVTEEFTASQPLTDQQTAAREAIRSGAVRFQPLPGQVEGSRLMLSAVKSQPQWLAEFEPELVANYREGSRLIKAGLNIPDGTPLTDELLDVAESTIGARFNAVRDMVTQPIKLSPEVIEVAEPALSAWQKRAIKFTETSEPGRYGFQVTRDGVEQSRHTSQALAEKAAARLQAMSNGKLPAGTFKAAEVSSESARALPASEVFEVRSRLNDLSRELGRKGEMTARDDVVRAIEEIDDAIEAQIGEAGRQAWQEARNLWRVKLMIDNPNAINKAGQLNVATLANQAQKIFGKQYRGWGPRKGLPEPTQQLIDWLKVANAFPDAVGNSGTAERLISMEALSNPVKYARMRATGKAIRFIADSTQPAAPPP